MASFFIFVVSNPGSYPFKGIDFIKLSFEEMKDIIKHVALGNKLSWGFPLGNAKGSKLYTFVENTVFYISKLKRSFLVPGPTGPNKGMAPMGPGTNRA